MSNEFRIPSQGPGIPDPALSQGIQIIEDVIEPKYPNTGELGAFLIFQRPGELGFVGVPVPIAYGAMIAVIPIGMAQILRGEMAKAVALQKAAAEKAARSNGRVG